MSHGKKAYFSCMMPYHLKNDIKKESEDNGITQDRLIEIRFYGYELKEEVAEEAVQALKKQIKLEEKRNKTIEEWWKKKTGIVKSCYDILKESIEK